VSHPPLLEEGPLPADLASAVSEAPKANENQDGDDVEGSVEDTSSTTSPPLALSKETCIDKKRKREELVSLSTSAQRTAAGEPLFKKKMLNFLASWHRKFSLRSMVLLYLLYSFRVVKNLFSFCFQ
jgi:hypothetical protein